MNKKIVSEVFFLLLFSTILCNSAASSVSEQGRRDDINTLTRNGEMNTKESYTELPVSSTNSTTYTQTIGNALGMDEYRGSDQDFGWTHTFDPSGTTISSVSLEIMAWDVDYDSGERDLIYVDGNMIGELKGADGASTNTMFTIDLTLLTDGTLNVWIDVDSTNDGWAVMIDWSRLTVVYVGNTLTNILNAYYKEIPANGGWWWAAGPCAGYLYNLQNGPFMPGDYVCGSYQAIILAWLDEKRITNPSFLAGWDYGPIRPWLRWHRAVVIYPSGTDWKKTGTVLDPWPKQEPDHYSIGEWVEEYSSVGGLIHEPIYPNLYPTGGNPYPASPTYPDPYPLKKQVIIKGKAHSRIQDPAGNKVGRLSNGTLVNDFSDYVEFGAGDAYGVPLMYIGLTGDGPYSLYVYGFDTSTIEIIIATYGSQVFSIYPSFNVGSGTIGYADLVAKDAPLVLDNATTIYPSMSNSSDPLSSDPDVDGLANAVETYCFGTNPQSYDTDADGMPDGYETSYPCCLNPLINDAAADPDHDGRTNIQEYNLGSDPCVSDLPQGVGGVVTPIDKLGLLAPYIGLTSTISVAAVATAIYAKRVRRGKRSNEHR